MFIKYMNKLYSEIIFSVSDVVLNISNFIWLVITLGRLHVYTCKYEVRRRPNPAAHIILTPEKQ